MNLSYLIFFGDEKCVILAKLYYWLCWLLLYSVLTLLIYMHRMILKRKSLLLKIINKVEDLNKKSSDNLNEAKTYTNTIASSTEQVCRDLVSSNLEASISYTDNKANMIMTDVKTYANSLASSTEQACKALVAPEVETVKTYADEKANKALTDSKTYADEKANKALTDAKTYADEKATPTCICKIETFLMFYTKTKRN